MAAVRTASSMAWAWSPAGNARAIVIALTIEASRVQASCCFSSGGAVHGGGEGGDDVSDPVLIRRAARVARTCHVRTERGHHTAVTGADAASASTPTAWNALLERAAGLPQDRGPVLHPVDVRRRAAVLARLADPEDAREVSGAFPVSVEAVRLPDEV